MHVSIDSVQELKADASDRKIFRINTGHETHIGIYNENVKENRAFISFSKTFKELSFNVPQIYCVSEDEFFYLEEDLGDMTLFRFSHEKNYTELVKYYHKAIEDLIGFQLNAIDKIDYNLCVSSKELDDVIIKSDLSKFYNYYIKKYYKEKPGSNDIDVSLIHGITEKFTSLNTNTDKNFFMYRDFQPRNIMLKGDSLYYIDYQSGMRGPLQYDLASFLYSGSVFLKEEEKEELLDYYLEIINKQIKIDENGFRETFYYYALLRIFQVLGSYGYQFEKKGDMKMLSKMKKALYNLEEIKGFIGESKMKNFIEGLLSDVNSDT